MKVSDNCQEHTSAGTSFWIKIGSSCRPAITFIKKDSLAQVFSCESCETFIMIPSSNKWIKTLARHYSEAVVHRKPATWLKKDSSTGAFQWLLRIF